MTKIDSATPAVPNALKLVLAVAMRAALAVVLAAALAGGTGPLHAQDDDPPLFGEVVDVRVVNLEAVVTDRDGNRVTGLAPEDFVLTVDGQEIAIEYFTEILGGTAVERGDEGEALTVPAVLPGEPVGTSYLVFIDDFFSRKWERNRVLDQMIEQIPLMSPEDRMAIVAFDGQELEMLSTWSQSTPALTDAFLAAKERPARGLQSDMHQRILRRDYRQQRRFGAGDGVIGDVFLREIAERLERVTLAVTTALRSFAQPPGRKAMLLLSGGWPDAPADLLTDRPGLAVYIDSLGYARSIYDPMLDTANRLSYTLYPVDVRGLRSESGASAEFDSLAEANFASRQATNQDFSENASLRHLARETGGEAFINQQNRFAFERTVADTRSYYWLGFTPTWRGENRRHRVRLEVRDPKLRVRTRRSFSDLARQTEVTMMVESALLFGNPPDAAALAAEAGPAQRQGRRLLVPLRLEVPADDLTFLPHAAGWRSEVEVRIAVEDKNGDRNDIPVIPVAFNLAEEPRDGQVVSWETSILMRRLRHDVVLSLYDKASGRILWTRLEVDPSKT